ncbi:hypothetical protein ACO2Q9_17400 [Variovorax sp. VNK109]|uniref:hypothetical protein n=1 Tax=Variovorax sp. VNK109 TaxID=3400919 RepID=UPI003BFA8B7A
MKYAFASLPALTLALALPLSLALPLTAHAQTAKPEAKTAPAAKPKPKLARSAAKAVEEVTPIDDHPDVTLEDAELEIAKKVYIGHIPCELGASVQITPSRREGFFIVQTRNNRFNMHPVASRTGAIRLEDPKRGALWLQLGNKSMLMSQKLGLRLADECTSPEQVTFADQMKKNPPRSLLEPETPAGPPSTRN